METINDRIAMIVKQSGLTKTEFAKRLDVTQQYVSKMEKEGTPSDRTIVTICRKFDVNEQWLRTGEGEMYVALNRRQEIAEFTGSLLSGEDDDFKHRFISMLARLSEKEWEFIEQKALELLDGRKKD